VDTIVITGVGLIAPTGNTLGAFWAALIGGHGRIRRITSFDPASYACQMAGEVDDVSFKQDIAPRKLRTTTRVTQLLLAAAMRAMDDARVLPGTYAPEAIGVSIGTALGGWRDGERQLGVLNERGAERINPFVANGAPNHVPALELAGALNAQGPHATFSVGCSASSQAIGYAVSLIRGGELDLCVAGGAEAPLTPLVLAGLARSMELSTRNEEPERASCPFDVEHNGIVLSEGSCLFVLERADRAAARGATVYGTVESFATSCDAKGIFAMDESGEVGARALRRALALARLETGDIDYVCSHANSSPMFDRKETAVIKQAFGDKAHDVPISSIKAVIGHPFGASGAFQMAATLLAMRHRTIPPTHNLYHPDPLCDLDYVPLEPRTAAIRRALVTSYGYGGVNAYLVLGSGSN
jgi:3-oxoacyl-(acyl-carrier-protein) synthase